MENLYAYKTATLAISIKDADTKKGIVTGYFAAFGNKDSDGDIIMPGAFTKSIEDRGVNSRQPRIKHLLNHRTDQPLGKLLILQEDSTGLYYESQIGSHSLGKEFMKMVESELITEHSIGYRPIKWEQDKDDKETTRLTELQLWEGSSLTFLGANQLTPLTGLKQADKKTQIETLLTRQAAIERFCRNADATDETIELLLLTNKQLSQIIIDFTKETTKPEGDSTLPDNKDEIQLIDGINSIYSLLNYQTNGRRRNKIPSYSDT
jgi:phage prohead protease, HK97 family